METSIANREGGDWVSIPSGRFWMGARRSAGVNCDLEASDNEEPVHEVYLDSFFMSRSPVTVREYAGFVAQGGYEQPTLWRLDHRADFSEPYNWAAQYQHLDRPVVGVSWFEAAAYCAWADGRLPTEAEWERAARGPGSSRYPWGDHPPLAPALASYGQKHGHATPVGLYAFGKSTEGLHDLLGNVWEWVSDWFGEDYYKTSPSNNPQGPNEGGTKVLRGGAWDFGAGSSRVSERYRNPPLFRFDDIGFRAVRDHKNARF